jgi:hypothetical protein
MNRPLRYVVEFSELDSWGNPLRISYNCGLGNREAKSYAIHTACRYGGRVVLQLTDDTWELIRDYSRRKYDEVADEPQKTVAVSV